jgi:hemolysin type calcium-binding protein
MSSRLAVSFVILALLALALPVSSAADHVTANPTVSARLGEPVGDRNWQVVVDWGITCSGGGSTPQYGGDLNLVDQVTGEKMYLGGTFHGSGQDVELVSRRATPRYVRPVIKSWCSSGLPLLHGSGPFEVTGNVVEVPALGSDGSGGDHGGQGGRDFPGGGFGGPSDPLRPVGCGRKREGTPRADTLRGTSSGDLIFGLDGNDLIRGRAGNDCLIGDGGNDRLLGGKGSDRLTGGDGNDTLVGGKGVNRYDAGSGNEIVKAANGRRELVSCGEGRDRARVDRHDRVAACEKVTRVRVH